MFRALDLLGFAAVAVDREGFVNSANTCAARIFDKAFFIRARRLYVADLESKEKLDGLMTHVRTEVDSRLVRTVIARAGRLPIVIDALIGVRNDFRRPNTDALFLLTDLEDRRIVSPHSTEEIFGLTATQAKVASLLAEGNSLSEIAQDIGISSGTARNHLKAVFARTGTKRQGELISLLLRLR